MAFFIQLSPKGYEPECEVEFSADAKAFRSSTLADAFAVYKAEYAHLKLILLLPAADVPEVFLEVNKAQQKKLQQALPFLLEEKLLNDIENYHFVVINKTAEGCLVNYIERQYLESLAKTMTEQGVQCDCAVPVYRAFPSQYFGGDNAVLLAEDVYFHDANGAVHAIPSALYSSITVNDEQIQHDVYTLNDRESQFSSERLKGNLLTAEFEPLLKRKAGNFPWKYVASIAGIGFGLYLLMTAFEGYHYKNQAEHFAEQQKSLYLTYYPGSKARFYRKELENKLSASDLNGVNSGGEFTSIINSVSSVLGKAESNWGVEIDRLSFNQDRSSLDINVFASDFASLEQFKQQLSNQGVKAEIGATTNVGEKTRAQLKIMANEEG